MQQIDRGRRPLTGAAFVLAGLLLLGLLAWLANSGPIGVLSLPTLEAINDRPDIEARQSQEATCQGWDCWTGLGETRELDPAVALWAWVIAGLATVAICVWIVRSLWLSRRERRQVMTSATSVRTQPTWDRALAIDEIVEAVDFGLLSMEESGPAEGIIACWQAVEQAAVKVGMPQREVWETNSEYIARLLGLLVVDERAIAELGALYREARFSDHALGSSEQKAAERALETLRRDLVGSPLRRGVDQGRG